MDKVLTNYKHYLKIGDLYLFAYYLLLPYSLLSMSSFELLFHQNFYLSNLISAIILFLIFINVKDKFKIKG